MSEGAGCLCGQLRVAITGMPLRVRTCWCRDCQYWGSGNGTTNAAYRSSDLAVTGNLQWYQSVADSGNAMRRGFCPTCGTPMFTGMADYHDFIAIRVGALDDPGSVRPTEVIWTASAPNWACFDPDLKQVERQPPPIG